MDSIRQQVSDVLPASVTPAVTSSSVLPPHTPLQNDAGVSTSWRISRVVIGIAIAVVLIVAAFVVYKYMFCDECEDDNNTELDIGDAKPQTIKDLKTPPPAAAASAAAAVPPANDDLFQRIDPNKHTRSS